MYYIPLIVFGSLAFFAGLWCAVLAILSFLGGWRRLAALHPAPDHMLTTGREFTFQSARMRMVNYSLCVKVRIHDEGIVVSIAKLFSFMHKPVFIPYSEMKEPSIGRFVTEYIVFRTSDVRIEIYGSSAEEIRQRLNRILNR